MSKLIGLRGNIRESNSLNFSAASTINIKKRIRKHSKLFMLTQFVFLDVDICFELCEEMEEEEEAEL